MSEAFLFDTLEKLSEKPLNPINFNLSRGSIDINECTRRESNPQSHLGLGF